MNKIAPNNNNRLIQFFAGQVKGSYSNRTCEYLTPFDLASLRDVSRFFRVKIEISSEALERDGIEAYPNRKNMANYKCYVIRYCKYFVKRGILKGLDQVWFSGFKTFNMRIDIFDLKQRIELALVRKGVFFVSELLEQELSGNRLENIDLLINSGATSKRTLSTIGCIIPLITAKRMVTAGIKFENRLIMIPVRQNLPSFVKVFIAGGATPTAEMIKQAIELRCASDILRALINANREGLDEHIVSDAIYSRYPDDIIEMLIDKARDLKDTDLITDAIRNGYPYNIIKKIIDKGARLGPHILMDAITSKSSSEVLQLLMFHGAKPNQSILKKIFDKTQPNSKTTIIEDNVPIVVEFILNSATLEIIYEHSPEVLLGMINGGIKLGEGLLTKAVMRNYPFKIILALIKAGVKPDKWTLEKALRYSSEEVILFLIRNVIFQFTTEMLRLAVFYECSSEVVLALTGAGARSNIMIVEDACESGYPKEVIDDLIKVRD